MPGKLRPRLDTRVFVCPQCRLNQSLRNVELARIRHTRWSSTTSTKSVAIPGFIPPQTELKKPAYACLTNRAIIRLQGPDAVDYLNGLLPAGLQPLPKTESTPIFTAFLSAKGRILYEAFIYPPTESNPEGPWYIDVDGASQSALFSHLKKHKLRSKFKLEKVSDTELCVYYMWPGQENSKTHLTSLGGKDPRPLMGLRFLSAPSTIVSSLRSGDSALSVDDYNIHRILSGHAEGPRELIANSALPQESNIDFDNGIDFHKGCYLGQELTIRTHHTGIVRKRILPCQICPGDDIIDKNLQTPIYDASVSVFQPPSEANISKKNAKGRSGRSTGKWLGGVGNVGLALCRLETMTDIQLTAEGTSFDPDGEFTIVWEEAEADADGKTAVREVKVRPFVPQWLRDNIQAGIQARVDRSKRRRRDEEDEYEDVD